MVGGREGEGAVSMVLARALEDPATAVSPAVGPVARTTARMDRLVSFYLNFCVFIINQSEF